MSLGLFVITIHLFTFVFFCQLSARFSSLFLPHGNRLSHPSMDRHLDNYQAVVGDALRLLESSQLSDARLSSWQTVLCGLLLSAANSTAGRHTTTNPTGTLQFPTDLPSLNARLSEPFCPHCVRHSSIGRHFAVLPTVHRLCQHRRSVSGSTKQLTPSGSWASARDV